MTTTERRQQLSVLLTAQQQFELLSSEEGGVLMVAAPGTIDKHVYSGNLAHKISRAIARTLEQERMQIIANHRNNYGTAYTPTPAR